MTPDEIRRFQFDFGARLYEQYVKSVVYVTGDFIDPQQKELDEFFNLSDRRLPNAIGTGFFVLPSGYILTNAHGVFKSVNQIVETYDGNRYPAQIVGFIMNQDLALLKVDLPSPAPCVKFKPDGKILTGEPILTIGHPHGLKYTCTQGIVSATGRRSTLTDIKVTLDNLLQSDAGINPGSSGGPWFNAFGEVVGMTASRRSGSDNIAFGIAATTFYREMPRLFDFENRRGFQLGVRVRGFDELILSEVQPDSAAKQAGIQENDILLEIDGKPLGCMVDYESYAENFSAGKSMDWKIVRKVDGKKEEKTLKITPLPAPKLDANALLWQKVGLKVRQIAENEASLCSLRVPKGFIIQQINPEYFKSLTHPPKVGDILAKFDNIRPENMEHLARLLNNLNKGEKTNLVVLRITDSKTQESLIPAVTIEPEPQTVSATPTDSAVNGKTDNTPPNSPAESSDNVQVEQQPAAADGQADAQPENAAPNKTDNSDNMKEPGEPGTQVKTRIDISDFTIQ